MESSGCLSTSRDHFEITYMGLMIGKRSAHVLRASIGCHRQTKPSDLNVRHCKCSWKRWKSSQTRQKSTMKIQQTQYFWLTRGHLSYTVHFYMLYIYTHINLYSILIIYPQQPCGSIVVLCRSIKTGTRVLGWHLKACQRYLLVYFSMHFFLKLRAIFLVNPWLTTAAQAMSFAC